MRVMPYIHVYNKQLNQSLGHQPHELVRGLPHLLVLGELLLVLPRLRHRPRLPPAPAPVQLLEFAAELLAEGEFLVVHVLLEALGLHAVRECGFEVALELEEGVEGAVGEAEGGQQLAVLQLELEGADVVVAVALAGHPQAVLHLPHELLGLALLVEVEGVGEVEDPGVGVVAGEAGEDLDCAVVVLEGVLGVVEPPQELVEVGVGDGVGHVVLPHLLLPDRDGPPHVLLEGQGLPHADQHRRLLLVDAGQVRPGVHVLGLELGDLLADVQLLEGEVVLELPVEHFGLLHADLQVVGVPHQGPVVLPVVHLHQAPPQHLPRLLHLPERPLQLPPRQTHPRQQQVAPRPLRVVLREPDGGGVLGSLLRVLEAGEVVVELHHLVPHCEVLRVLPPLVVGDVLCGAGEGVLGLVVEVLVGFVVVPGLGLEGHVLVLDLHVVGVVLVLGTVLGVLPGQGLQEELLAQQGLPPRPQHPVVHPQRLVEGLLLLHRGYSLLHELLVLLLVGGSVLEQAGLHGLVLGSHHGAQRLVLLGHLVEVQSRLLAGLLEQLPVVAQLCHPGDEVLDLEGELVQLVLAVLEAHLVGLDPQELQLPLLLQLLRGSAAAHAAEGPQPVPPPHLLPPALERPLLLLHDFLGLEEVEVAALDVAHPQPPLRPLLEEPALCEPVFPQDADVLVDGGLEVDEVLLGVEDVLVGLVLGVALLHLPVVLGVLAEFLEGEEGVAVGLLEVPALQLRVGYLRVDPVVGLPLLDLHLVVLDAPVVFLSQQQDVPVVLDPLELLQTVLVVGDHSLLHRSQPLGLCPQQAQHGSVLEGDLAGGRGQVQGHHPEHVEGVEQYLLLVLEGLVGQSEPVDLHEPVVVQHLLLPLAPHLHHYLKQVGVVVHELLSLRPLERGRGEPQELNVAPHLQAGCVVVSQLGPAVGDYAFAAGPFLAVALVVVLDGVVGFVEGDGDGPELLGGVGEPEDGVGECVVEGLPHVEVYDLPGLPLRVLLAVVDPLVLLQVGQLLGHLRVPHLHHVRELLQVARPLLPVPELEGPVEAEAIGGDFGGVVTGEGDEAGEPKLGPLLLQGIVHHHKLGLVGDVVRCLLCCVPDLHEHALDLLAGPLELEGAVDASLPLGVVEVDGDDVLVGLALLEEGLCALHVGHHLEEAALQPEELEGVLVAPADGHLVLVLDVLPVDRPYHPHALLPDARVEDEQPDEGRLPRKEPTHDLDVPLPLSPLPLLENPPLLLLRLLALLLVPRPAPLDALAGGGGVDVSADGEGEGVGVVAAEVVVVRLLQVVVPAGDNVYIMDVPVAPLPVLALLLLRVLPLPPLLHYRVRYLHLAQPHLHQRGLLRPVFPALGQEVDFGEFEVVLGGRFTGVFGDGAYFPFVMGQIEFIDDLILVLDGLIVDDEFAVVGGQSLIVGVLGGGPEDLGVGGHQLGERLFLHVRDVIYF